jgi:excisionase family DNA binding protein
MGMDRLLERLRGGSGPPLRVSEFARLIGYSLPTVRKLIDAGEIKTVGLTEEQRIPIREALRIARDLKIVEN